MAMAAGLTLLACGRMGAMAAAATVTLLKPADLKPHGAD